MFRKQVAVAGVGVLALVVEVSAQPVVDLEMQPAGRSAIAAPLMTPFNLIVLGLPGYGYTVEVKAVGNWSPSTVLAPVGPVLEPVPPPIGWTVVPGAACQKAWPAIESLARTRDAKAARFLRDGNTLASVVVACTEDFRRDLDVARWFQRLMTRADASIPWWSGTLASDGKLEIVARRAPAPGVEAKEWLIEVLPGGTGTSASPAPRSPDVPAEPRLGSFTNELEWIVTEVLRDISEMALLAQGRPAYLGTALFVSMPDKEGSSIGVQCLQCPSISRNIETVESSLAPHPWATRTYEAWTRQLFKGIRRTRSPSATTLDLHNADTAALIAADRALSQSLSASPRDPDLHDRAALLIGALALRKSGGRFNEVRLHLNRMTAHLAVAEGLRGDEPPADLHDVGLALVELLAGRTLAASVRSDEVAARARTEDVRTWARLIRLAATNDWRIVPDPARSTHLEKSLLFSALLSTHDGGIAIRRSAPWRPNTSETAQRTLAFDSFSVETGHQFARGLVDAEIGEMAAALRDFQQGNPGPEEIRRPLDAQPRRAVRIDGRASIEVIGWGLWSDLFRDRILAALEGERAHRRRTAAGPPPGAAEMLEKRLGTFGRRLRGFTEQAPYWDEETCLGWSIEIQRDPAATSSDVWSLIQNHCPRAPDPSWNRVLLPGTSYQAAKRLASLALASAHGLSPQARIRMGESAVALNPFDASLIQAARIGASSGTAVTSVPTGLKEPNPNCAPSPPPSVTDLVTADFADELRGLVGYNGKAISLLIARGARPEERQALYSAWEDYSAEALWQAAEWAERQGNVAEAARRFEQLLEADVDQVRLSQRLDFLADHYLESGRPEDALSVARRAASTGSGGGLFTLGRILERLNRFDDAERAYSMIRERYRDRFFEDAFHVRRAVRLGLEVSPDQGALERLFPAGLRRAPASPDPSAHASWVPLWRVGSRTRERLGAINATDRPTSLIALDGYLVSTADEVSAVFSFTDAPTARAFVDRCGPLELVETVRRFKYGAPQKQP